MDLMISPSWPSQRQAPDWWDDDAKPCEVCRWVTRHHADCHRVLDVDVEVLEAD